MWKLFALAKLTDLYNYEFVLSIVQYLYDWHVISLCFSHVGHIILQLEAWKVVIDILQDQVDGHERSGGHSFSLHNKTQSGSVFKVQPLGALHLDFTWKTGDQALDSFFKRD